MRYKARWSDDPERRLYNGANGAVDDTLADKKMVCATVNMATAERVADALNLMSRYSDDELKSMALSLKD